MAGECVLAHGAAGAAWVMVETHSDPGLALSGGAQAVALEDVGRSCAPRGRRTRRAPDNPVIINKFNRWEVNLKSNKLWMRNLLRMSAKCKILH